MPLHYSEDNDCCTGIINLPKWIIEMNEGIHISLSLAIQLHLQDFVVVAHI